MKKVERLKVNIYLTEHSVAFCLAEAPEMSYGSLRSASCFKSAGKIEETVRVTSLVIM